MEPADADTRIQEFRNIIGRNLSDEECTRVLDVCDWDSAVNYFQDNGIPSQVVTATNTGAGNAPTPARQGWFQYGWSWVSWTLGLAKYFIGNLWPGKILGSLFPGADPSPRSEVEALERLLTSKYGPACPNFFKGSYQQALARAKEDFKFLVIYVHSDIHSDSPRFCREVLCSELVSDFLNSNFVIWGGSVNGTQGFRISQLLGAYGFPFFAVCCHYPATMAIPPQIKASVLGGGVAVIDRIDGAISGEDLIARLTGVMETFNPVLIAARADYDERSRDRMLRDEQDKAYKESLAVDREKERRRREEEERVRREEQEARRAAEEEVEREKQRQAEEGRKQREREMKAQELPTEPNPGEPGIVTVVVRLFDGSRCQRRFLDSHSMSTVYKYVESQETIERWELVTHYPKQTYANNNATLKECGFVKQAVLFVQEILE